MNSEEGLLRRNGEQLQMWNHNEMHCIDSFILWYSGTKSAYTALAGLMRGNIRTLECFLARKNTLCICMLALHNQGEEQFSEDSEAVV